MQDHPRTVAAAVKKKRDKFLLKELIFLAKLISIPAR